MASAPQGDARLAGLDQELRNLRMRLEAVRRGIVVDEPGALAEEAAESFGDDEVLARLRGLLDELKAVTGEGECESP